MESAFAGLWNTDFAFAAARQIASMSSLYCGPASSAWIAAVWNHSKGRQYDLGRLRDKKLFQDGPRLYHGRTLGFQLSLSDLLLRETNGELRLASETYFRVDTIHRQLAKHDLPIIIRLTGPNIRNGLHYVVAFRSELSGVGQQRTIQIYSQDNGVLGAGNSGINKAIFQNDSHLFIWGAKRVQVE